MRLFIISVVSIILTVGTCLIFPSDKNDIQIKPEGTTEGFGVNPGSRKYYEYLRQRDPLTGEVPSRIKQRSREFADRLPKKTSSRELEWQQRGPVNIGGRTRAFAVDITNDEVLLSGSVTGGLWRTEDSGVTWEKTTDPGQLQSVSCIVQDTRPGHEDTWYYGTGEEFYGVVSGTSFTSLLSGDGIFKSEDGGLSWNQLEATASGTPQTVLQNGSYDFVWRMAVDHTNEAEDEVYAAVYNGIIRSTDGGDSWTEVLGFWPSPASYTDLIITPSGVLYATFSYANGAYPGGIYRSEDGINWTLISTDELFYSQQRIALACNPSNDDEVYFIAEMNNDMNSLGHVLYKYTYLGGDGSGGNGTWEDRSANLPDDSCELYLGVDVEFGIFRSQNSYDLCIAHHPEEEVLFIGGTNVYRSLSAFANDDQSWIGGYKCNEDNPADYVYPNHHPDQHFIAFSPADPDKMYSLNDGGIFVTEDPFADSVQWTSLNNGYFTTQFYSVALEQGMSESDYVFGGMQDNGTWIGTSTNVTDSWKQLHSDDGSYCAMPEGHGFVITSSQLGRMYKKTMDDNGNLTATKRIDPAGGPSALFVNPLMLDPFSHNDLYMAGNKTIWWLPNVSEVPMDGENFEQLDNDYWVNISESIIPTLSGSISCLDKPLVNNNVIYYGSTGGSAFRLDDCFAEEPIKTNITGDNFPAGYTSCIRANDLNEDEVILSFSNYNIPSIFHSLDGGTTWTDISGNLEENPDGTGVGPGVYWVEIYPTDPVIYFAGTSTGLYSTTELDGSNTIWEMEGANSIGNVVINMIETRLWDGTIVVGTHGNGIFSSSLTPVVGVEDLLSPKHADINAFPNPFNTTVNLNLPSIHSTEVLLEIFDVNGRKILSERKTVSKDARTIQWTPGIKQENGTYLYIFESGGISSTGKLIFRR